MISMDSSAGSEWRNGRWQLHKKTRNWKRDYHEPVPGLPFTSEEIPFENSTPLDTEGAKRSVCLRLPLRCVTCGRQKPITGSKQLRGTSILLCFYFIRLLTVVGQPFTFGQFHIRENCLEGGILRRAGIDAEADFSAALPHVAHTHLGEIHTIC